ncbi:MAG: putative lipid II flippase FtsW [Gammaproteobacteria bacterium]
MTYKAPSASRVTHSLGNVVSSARSTLAHTQRWHPWQAIGMAPESVLLMVTLLLAGLGWVMVTSASTEIGLSLQHDSLYYCKRHGVFLLLGLIAFWISSRCQLETVERWAMPLLLGSVLLLLALRIPGVGYKANGSVRWLNLGFIRLQVSELTKFALIVYWASLLPKLVGCGRPRVWVLAWPAALLFVMACGLMLIQPDLGATFVVLTLTLGLLFVAGAPLLWFVSLGSLCAGGVALLVWTVPYRLKRVMAFWDPWEQPFETGYQLVQSLIAIGRGGVLGNGLGSSVQKNFYLPEAHTDFIYAVLCEELGILGGVAVLLAYLFLLAAVYTIGRTAERLNNSFGAYLCYGTALLIAIQAFVSIGVNIGLLPTKGLTLPFISYGGTSLVVLFCLMGMVYRVQRENRMRLGWSRAYWQGARAKRSGRG